MDSATHGLVYVAFLCRYGTLHLMTNFENWCKEIISQYQFRFRPSSVLFMNFHFIHVWRFQDVNEISCSFNWHHGNVTMSGVAYHLRPRRIYLPSTRRWRLGRFIVVCCYLSLLPSIAYMPSCRFSRQH